MTLKVASWNIEGRLSPLAINNRGTPEQILREIERLNVDIFVLLEAFGPDMFAEEIQAALMKLGYQMYHVPYDDGGPVRTEIAVEEPSMLLLSKIPVLRQETVRFGDLRNSIVVIVKDPESGRELRVLGVHLEDRAENMRLQQVPDIVKFVEAEPIPTIIMGDFNAMHGGDWQARLLRNPIIRRFARASGLSVARRICDMAIGSTLELLQQKTGYRDADPHHHPTTTPKMRGREWLPSVRLVQIDHMLVSPEVRVSQFKVGADGGADHRAISAMITLDKS